MIAKTVLVDAGPLVAILSRRDEHHSRCIDAAQQLPAVLSTCWPVIAEAAHLLRGTSHGVKAILSRIEVGTLDILSLTAVDMAGIQSILSTYADQEFDFADACLMHLANRESINHIFTLDRRHFSIYRKTTGEALDLLPRSE